MEVIISESVSGLLYSFPLGFYFIKAFIVAAFSEEMLKLWVVRKYIYTSDYFEETALIYRGLLIAILVHGFYDFVLFAAPVLGIGPALSIFPLLVWGFLHLKKILPLR